MILTEAKKKKKKKGKKKKEKEKKKENACQQRSATPRPTYGHEHWFPGTSIGFRRSDSVLLSTATVPGDAPGSLTVFHNLLCGRPFWLGPECSPKSSMTPTVSQIQMASTLLLLSARAYGFAGFMFIRL